MITKFLSKLSGACLKAHRYLDYRLKMGPSFEPYTIKYPEKIGSKKVIHVIANFIVGGSTQLVVDIIERTSDRYIHKVVVRRLEGKLAYSPLDIREFSVAEMAGFSEWLRAEAPEFVHIHYFVRESDKYSEVELWYNTVFRICEDLGLKVIQNINVPTKPNPSPSVVHNVYVSKYVQREFNNSKVPSAVIYPGSNFAHFRNDEIDSLPSNSIGMVYRLDSDKLSHDAVEVFIEVAKRAPKIVSYIVGGGQMLQAFKQRVQDEKLGDRVIFTGFVSYGRLPEIYRNFSIFVAPVHDESFGQVTPFAMSMGQCVAGYNTGAMAEILGSENTLVKTGDIVGLSELIIKLIQDPTQRRKIGRFNQQRAYSEFTVERMIDQYLALYRIVENKSKF